jgi:hypothetical protein
MSTSKTIFNPLLSAGLQKLSTTAEGFAAAQKEPTGFEDPDNVGVSYNFTNRTITLTHSSGTIAYWYRGERYTVASPWTSAAHTDTTGAWFLTLNGAIATEAWSLTPWTFDVVMVAYVNFVSGSAVNTFALKETHGLMQWQAHEELHKNIGTYWVSGLGATAGTYVVYTSSTAPTLVADNTPGVDAGVVADEDIHTTIPALVQGTYTTAYRSGASGTWVFDTTDVLPYFEVANAIQYNQNTGATWQLTPLAEDDFVNVYDFVFPVASDADSQKYRHVWITGQATYTSLASALLEFPDNLDLGSLANLAPEFVGVTRFTYQYNTTGLGAVGVGVTGRCKIMAMTPIRGTRANQTAVSGSAPSDHGNFSGLADDDHTQYELIRGRAANVVGQSSNFTMDAGVILYEVDTSGGNITVTLLDPAAVPGKLVTFLNTSTNNITFGSYPIAGVSNFTIDGNERIQLVSNGTTWKQYARKNMSFWKTGITYCKDVLIEVNEVGFEGLWRCTAQHTAAAAFSTDVASRWDYVGGERTARWINSPGHTFSVGNWIYRKTDGTWARAKADVEATAEVVGVVSAVVTNYFLLVEHGYFRRIGGSYNDGAVQFLDTAIAGNQVETKPSIAGQVIVALGHAIGTSEMMVRPMIGVVVGGTNLYSGDIALTGGASGGPFTTSFHTINCNAGSGGQLFGTIKIDASTDYTTSFIAYFTRSVDGNSYNVGWLPLNDFPSGMYITNSGSSMQIVMPNVSGFSSASVNYCNQSAANGTTFPTSISASNILGSTSGVAPAEGVVGNVKTANASAVTASGVGGTAIIASLSLEVGDWLISVTDSCFNGTRPSAGAVAGGFDIYNSTDASVILNMSILSYWGTTTGDFDTPYFMASATIPITVSGTKTIQFRLRCDDVGGATGTPTIGSRGYGKIIAIRR